MRKKPFSGKKKKKQLQLRRKKHKTLPNKGKSLRSTDENNTDDLPIEYLGDSSLVCYDEENSIDIFKRDPELVERYRKKGSDYKEFEKMEEEQFSEYCLMVDGCFELKGENKNVLFEKDIEKWRQLWRCIERSDLVIQLVDCRFPLFQFSVPLYHWVTEELGKKMILLLNKKDLIDDSVLDQWEKYFGGKYASLNVCRASSSSVKICLRTFLLSIVRDIFGQEIDSDKRTTLTIGVVGMPNVGKSSFINSVSGSHLVSTSSFPGKTRHFQTIVLQKLDREQGVKCEVILCDSPGIVFPSFHPTPLQVLIGVLPVSQVRKPFSAIRYLAERIELAKVLRLNPLKSTQEIFLWTPSSICEAYAIQKGYTMSRSGRPDIHRAGLEILKSCTQGKIAISWYPPASVGHMVPLKKRAQPSPSPEGDEDDSDFIIPSRRRQRMALDSGKGWGHSGMESPTNLELKKKKVSKKKQKKMEREVEWGDRQTEKQTRLNLEEKGTVIDVVFLSVANGN